MTINKKQFQNLINKCSKETNTSQQFIYYRFFFDSFIYRLSKSKYKNYLILKGGLYLSSLIGINSRSTIDIDFEIRYVKLEEKNLTRIVKEICSLSPLLFETLSLVKICRIRKRDLYGGYRLKLRGTIFNFKVEFFIDIATGDPISTINNFYNYKFLLNNKETNIKSYNLETYIAEKLETVLERNINNSRSKDLYDLYIIYKTQINNVNIKVLLESFDKTCKHRIFQ